MEIARFLLIVQARWKGVVASIAVLVALAIAAHVFLPPKYIASASVVVDVRGVNPVLGVAAGNNPMSNVVVGTQASIVRSEGVARQVASRLGLDTNPSVIATWRETAEGRGDVKAWVANVLLSKLDVRPNGESSNVLDIRFTSQSAEQAALVANTFADVYIATSASLRSDPAKVNASFFEKQAKTLRAELEKVQGKLSDYQQKAGIVSSDERLDVETAALNELSTQLMSSRAERIDTSSRQRQSSGRSSISPDVLRSPVVQQLSGALAVAETRLQELSARLGPNHPDVGRGRAEVAEAKAALNREMDRAASSLQVSDQVNQQREAALLSAMETQRSKVLEIKSHRDRIALMQRDVDSAKSAYDRAMERLSQTGQEGDIASADASILTTAATPMRSSRPGLELLLPMSIAVGALLGVLLALLREVFRPLIRTDGDLEAMDVPVLTSLARARLQIDSRARAKARQATLPSPMPRLKELTG